MKRLLVFLLALGLSAVAWAAQPLLSPTELQPLLSNKNVRVVDIRPADVYAKDHIPGSVSAPYGTWRGPANNAGQLPSIEDLTKRVQSLGLTPEQHIVVTSSGADQTDFGAAARVYWTLKYLGFKELSVLNGGIEAWAAAKLPQDQAAPAITASTYVPKLDPSIRATRDEVVDVVATGKASLVDARPPAQFEGKAKADAAKTAGTIKGAINVPNTAWFAEGSKTLYSQDQAKKVAAAAWLDPNRETVVFCNTGHWGATDWFALSEVAGVKGVKLYAESIVDWTNAPQALPMDNVPAAK